MISNSENKKAKSNSVFMANKLIFKKYKIIKLISEGVFGQIHLVINEKTRKYYAMKSEDKNSNYHILEQEAYNLYSIKGFGIPEFISFGKISNYNILIEEFLGKSLLALFTQNNYQFSIIDICLISIQLIDRIEFIHSKTFVHRDIKPENFLVGIEHPNIIYLTEFGLCTKYCSSKTRKHIMPGVRGTFTGTLRYSSANAQRGNQQSRRDDIESLGYTILFFMKGKLPWQNLNQNYNEKDIYIKTYAMKKYMPIEKLCKGLPQEMAEYFKYSRNLKFKDEPDYEFLRNLFKKILNDNGYKNFEELNFSWVIKSQAQSSKIKTKRTLSPKTRLYLKIKNQMKIKKEIESDHSNTVEKIKKNITMTNYNNNDINNYNRTLSLAQKEEKELKFKNQIQNTNQNNIGKINRDLVDINNNNRENIDKIDFEKKINQSKKIQNKERLIQLKEKYPPSSRELFNNNKLPNNINNIIINNKIEKINYYNKININENMNVNMNKKKSVNPKPIDLYKINNKIDKDIDKNNKFKKIISNDFNHKIKNYYTTDNNQFNFNSVKNKQNGINENQMIGKSISLTKNKINLTYINNQDNNIINLNKIKRNNIGNNEYIINDNNTNNIAKQKTNFRNINNNKNMDIMMAERKDVIKNDNSKNFNIKYQNVNNKNKNNKISNNINNNLIYKK